MDLGARLRSLGLAQYEAIFRENAIDADILRDLLTPAVAPASPSPDTAERRQVR